MRKYVKLAFVLVAFFSIIIMLIYRYKYHNLKSLIDVMNFFPAKQKTLDYPMKQTKYNLTEETTFNFNHWTELFQGIYIYSAHVMKPSIFFLAYSKSSTPIDLEDITCHLWLESQGKKIDSKLVVHYLSEINKSHFYFECFNNSDWTSPSAVTFNKEDISITIPIFHKQVYTGQIAACLNLPPNQFSDLVDIMEFLIYHSHIGIKHFLLYYTTFSSSVKEVLVKVATECDIIIEFLPWITPPFYEYTDLKLPPYFIDCMFHISSLNHSHFAFLLDLNEFIVLEGTESLDKLMRYNFPFDYLLMSKKIFCTEHTNNIIAEELNIKFKTLLKTKVSTIGGQEKKVVFNMKNPLFNKIPIKDVLKDWLLRENVQAAKVKKLLSANVHSYINCGSKNFSNTSLLVDNRMWSFKQVLFDSCIYKQAVSILGNDIA